MGGCDGPVGKGWARTAMLSISAAEKQYLVHKMD